MFRAIHAAHASVLLFAMQTATAQIAGSTTFDFGVARVEAISIGWSAKKQILGKTVYNEEGKKIGKIDDLIVAPDTSVSFAIIGAGGFVGLRRHQIALPVDLLSEQGGEFILEGATKQAIKDLPAFEYAGAEAPARRRSLRLPQ